MTARQGNISEVLKLLKQLYPQVQTALHHRDPYQLLAATILSAQCTDERVNKVTPAFFAKFPTPQALAQGRPAEVERLIHSTGFFRNKARNLLGMAKTVVKDFGGKIPRTMAELLTLPGVARKTANVLISEAYGRAEGIVVDTHVKRLSGRLGLSRENTPEKIEQDLMRQLPKTEWQWFGLRLIYHGRQVCFARNPNCAGCGLNKVCPSAFKV